MLSDTANRCEHDGALKRKKNGYFKLGIPNNQPP